MDAVDACGGRVTIGDVASKAGLKLNEAQKALQALAADTNGFLEVFPFDNPNFGCVIECMEFELVFFPFSFLDN